MTFNAGSTLPATSMELLRALSNQTKVRFSALAASAFTATTYANLASASLSFTKILGAAASDLEVQIEGEFYNSAGGTIYNFFFGVNINSTDYDVTRYFINAASDHRSACGSVRIPSVAAGVYTVQIRGKNDVAGRTTTVDNNDLIVLTVREIPIIP